MFGSEILLILLNIQAANIHTIKIGQTDQVPVRPNLSFESLKKLNQHAVEYWSARDLQACLGYSNWRDFKNAIKKAIQSCEQSGNSPNHHFADARKPIQGGKGSSQIVEDYTESDSRIGRGRGSAPSLSQALPTAKQLNLKGWAM
jgi:hypothetical protein